jgi:alcohol dehydrogenase
MPGADLNLLKIPEGIDDEQALFVGDILTTGVYGAGIAGIRSGDTVAVVGAGPVGFFAAQAARLHDPAQVLVLDMMADRLELAEKVGAATVNVGEQNAESVVDVLTEGRGPDAVIEAVGAVPAFQSEIDVLRRGGTICVVGLYVAESTELQLGTSWSGSSRSCSAGCVPSTRGGTGPSRRWPTGPSTHSRSSATGCPWKRPRRATSSSTSARPPRSSSRRSLFCQRPSRGISRICLPSTT